MYFEVMFTHIIWELVQNLKSRSVKHTAFLVSAYCVYVSLFLTCQNTPYQTME